MKTQTESLISKDTLYQQLRYMLRMVLQIETALRYHASEEYVSDELDGLALDEERCKSILHLVVNRAVFNIQACRHVDGYELDLRGDQDAQDVFKACYVAVNKVISRVFSECRGIGDVLGFLHEEKIIQEETKLLTKAVYGTWHQDGESDRRSG